MGFAELFGRLAGYFDATKILTLSVSGTLFVLGVLLWIDFPMPSYFEQRRPARVPTNRVSPSSIRCPNRQRSLTARDSVLCTIWVRDSIYRYDRHQTFDTLLAKLDSISVYHRRDSTERATLEAMVGGLASSFSEKVSANSILVLAEIRTLGLRLRALDSTMALRKKQITHWQRDSLRQSQGVALTDSSWAAFQDVGLSELLGRLGVDLLLLALLGLVVGAVLDPINKWVFAGSARAKPRTEDLRPAVPELFTAGYVHRGTVNSAPIFTYVGRGLLKTEQQDYLVQYYYRFAELTQALILPTVVLALGVAHAVSPTPLPWPLFTFVILVTLVSMVFAGFKERAQWERRKAVKEPWWKDWTLLVFVVVVILGCAFAMVWLRTESVACQWRLGGLALAGSIAYWLMDLAATRHGEYRKKQWEVCYGAEQTLQKAKEDDCLTQMAALKGEVAKLAKLMQDNKCCVSASILVILEDL